MAKSLRGFLSALGKDQRGNTLAIAAAAILLFLSAVGGGIDISRAYMAKTNLQSACDAGVLAGRKAMAAEGKYEADEKAKAVKMFNFNLNEKSTSSTDVNFTSQSHANGSVTGTASSKMPTMVMKIFGFSDFALSVECSAELQMASADIVFVLDTTGSMNCPATNWTCTTKATEDANSRLGALRQAVEDFHTTVAKAVIDKENTIIRYAFVPYSSTVNVSELVKDGQMPASWFVENRRYWSRSYKSGTTKFYNKSGSSDSTTYETYSSTLSQSNCNKYAANNYPTSGSTPTTSGTAPNDVVVSAYSLESFGGTSKKAGTCKRKVVKTTTTYDKTPYYKITSITKNVGTTLPTVDLIANKEVPTVDFENDSDQMANWQVPDSNKTYTPLQIAAVAKNAGYGILTGSAAQWNGCIEERATTTSATMDPVPSGAWDLNINDEPNGTTASQWAPYWPQVVSAPGNNQCTTSPILQFQVADTTNSNEVPNWVSTYLDDLAAAGSTYHDMGMIWAGRIGSTTGMFKDNVNTVEIGGKVAQRNSVSRHIIFMTDGMMDPSTSTYTAYGQQNRDGRVASTSINKTDLTTRHNNRFLAACRLAEQEGYTVWVVAFSDEVTMTMQDCSTDDRFYEATDTTSLSNAFKFIAGQVADLRINK